MRAGDDYSALICSVGCCRIESNRLTLKVVTDILDTIRIRGKAMKNRFHGVMAIVLVFISLLCAEISIFSSNWMWAALYPVIVLIATLAIISRYCTKCPHVPDDSCRHVIIGKIARLFRQRSGKYTRKDIGISCLSILCIVALPHLWLIRSPLFLIEFWVFLILAVFEISVFVCKQCKNIHCFQCPNK
jgi:hypothetical protein